jgi:hypothetical protein
MSSLKCYLSVLWYLFNYCLFKVLTKNFRHEAEKNKSHGYNFSGL